MSNQSVNEVPAKTGTERFRAGAVRVLEEEVKNHTELVPEQTLWLLRGQAKVFNYSRVFNELKNSGAAVKYVSIRSVNGRSPTFGHAVFESKDAVTNFLQNQCQPNEEHTGYTFALNNEGSEFIIVRRYDPNHVRRPRTSEQVDEKKNSRFSRPTRKLFVSGFTGKDVAQVNAFFVENKTELDSMTIRVNERGCNAVVFVKNGEHGKLLIENSYINKGIPFNGLTIKVRRYNSRQQNRFRN